MPTTLPQVTVLEGLTGPSGSSKFKLIGIVVNDAPFSTHLPFFGSGAVGHEDYVEAKVSGKLPGGF